MEPGGQQGTGEYLSERLPGYGRQIQVFFKTNTLFRSEKKYKFDYNDNTLRNSDNYISLQLGVKKQLTRKKYLSKGNSNNKAVWPNE